MKSQKKRTLARKPKQQRRPKMDDQKDDNTIVLDIGNYGAAQPTYNLSSGGIDTITIDSNNFYTGSITSANTLTWSQPYDNYTISNTWNNDSWVNISSDGITMKEGSDIKIGSRSLTEAISAIEDRLAILKPNPELEDRWEQLKDLRRQYEALEKDLLEKEKIMKILKEK